MVEYFVNGGPFMWPILILLIAGLGISGERFYSLFISSTNTKEFFDDVIKSLDNDGIDNTIELCNNTPGPVAEILSEPSGGWQEHQATGSMYGVNWGNQA